MSDKPVAISVIALINGEDILLIKRVKAPYKDHWALPGGKIEVGEHIDEAALRELFEETGIKATFEKIVGVANEILYNENRAVKQFVIFVCKLHSAKREVKATDEGELKWFSLKDLEKNKKLIVPSDIMMIKEFVLKDQKVKVHKIKMVERGEKLELEDFRGE